MSRQVALWTYIGAAPALWFLNMEANFAISPRFCAGTSPGIPLLLSLCALFGTVMLAILSWRILRRMHGDASIALAAGAALVNACAALVIAAQIIPILLLAGCP
jgi:hypothetical protein